MAHVHYILKAPAGFNCADNADRLHFSTLSPGATHTLLRTRGEHQIYIFHHSPGCQSPNPKSKWYFPRAGGATRKMQSEQWRINVHDSNMAANMDLIMHATQRHSQRGLHIRRTRAHQYKRAVHPLVVVALHMRTTLSQRAIHHRRRFAALGCENEISNNKHTHCAKGEMNLRLMFQCNHSERN